MSSYIKKLSALLFSAAILLSVVIALFQLQTIIDWWKLRGYQPSLAIEQLAMNSGMSDEGKKLFYVHDPQLVNDKKVFREKCVFEEFTIVLGCYISHQRIYIFDISDERLAGAEEVTVAHEMLHAAYDRLSLQERDSLERQLSAVLETLTDKRILQTIQSYRDSNPSIVPNELHSILGTELRDLTPELEKHYSRYFSDRKKVVSLAERYATEFTKRKEQISEYDRQLEQKQGRIVTLNASLSELGSELEREQRRLNSLRSNPEAFNREVEQYNNKVDQFNGIIEQLQKITDEYNQLVDDRNAIAIEERNLIEAIDTSTRPLRQ
jgi:hypothetical protein